MQLRKLEPNSSCQGWDEKWTTIFDHYQQDLRHAYYIHAMLHNWESRILEMAGGSFRDMAELRRRGIDCEGMDFSHESVRLAKLQFPDFAHAIYQMNAFNMSFADNIFDVTYHNGFWSCFEDEQIKLLSIEQARITRHRMIVTVHNAHNLKFMEYFDKMKIDDPLYDIRFFEMEEIGELMRQVCRDVVIVPVGKGKKHHEDLLIKNGITDPKSIRSTIEKAKLKYLKNSERLMCIGTVI